MLSVLPAGDQEKLDFEKLYNENAAWMLRVAESILRDHQEAEDAVQEAFLTIARHYGKYAGKDAAQMKAVCTVITRSRAINLLRKRGREAPPVDTEEMPLAAEESDPGAEMLLREAIAALPPQQREIFLLWYADNCDAAAIAAALNITPAAVRKSLYRTKQALRRYLTEE